MYKGHRVDLSGARVTTFLHHGDLPDGLDLGPVVALDSETMGLRYRRE